MSASGFEEVNGAAVLAGNPDVAANLIHRNETIGRRGDHDGSACAWEAVGGRVPPWINEGF